MLKSFILTFHGNAWMRKDKLHLVDLGFVCKLNSKGGIGVMLIEIDELSFAKR